MLTSATFSCRGVALAHVGAKDAGLPVLAGQPGENAVGGLEVLHACTRELRPLRACHVEAGQHIARYGRTLRAERTVRPRAELAQHLLLREHGATRQVLLADQVHQKPDLDALLLADLAELFVGE